MAGSARPDAVRLASGGQSEYAILTGKNPSATVELAAAELARYLEQISGVELPIIQDDIDNCSFCGGRGATRATADTACLAAAWRRRAVRPPTTDTAIRLQVKSSGEMQKSATWRGERATYVVLGRKHTPSEFRRAQRSRPTVADCA